MGASKKDELAAFLQSGAWKDEDLTSYRGLIDDMERSDPSHTITEGHSGQVEVQQKFYRALARQPFVNTVCEIGFNAGHSSANWLSAKPGNRLISFDLGKHDYTKPRANYLKEKFPGRMFIIFGDSTVTVPAFHKRNPDVNCDVLVVDGGHSFDNADVDIGNMRYLANRFFNAFVMDDINCDGMVMHSKKRFCVGPDKAIQAHKLAGEVRMLEMITSTQGRGFGLGEYLFHQAPWMSLDPMGQGAGEMVASQRAQPAPQGSGLPPSREEEEEELPEFEKFKRNSAVAKHTRTQ